MRPKYTIKLITRLINSINEEGYEVRNKIDLHGGKGSSGSSKSVDNSLNVLWDLSEIEGNLVVLILWRGKGTLPWLVSPLTSVFTLKINEKCDQGF